jgi:hypothetical protein
LTTHGFGFSLANGNYANPFYNGSIYYEYLSVPPYVNGAGPERPVTFSAAIVPEPSAASLLLSAVVGLIVPRARHVHARKKKAALLFPDGVAPR